MTTLKRSMNRQCLRDIDRFPKPLLLVMPRLDRGIHSRRVRPQGDAKADIDNAAPGGIVGDKARARIRTKDNPRTVLARQRSSAICSAGRCLAMSLSWIGMPISPLHHASHGPPPP